MSRKLDLSGQQFGRLSVSEEADPPFAESKPNTWWRCECDCGKVTVVRTISLRAGDTRSCGCLSDEVRRSTASKACRITHGQTKTREYRIWQGMLQRCTNPNCEEYPIYGGRGIIVCPAWSESFEAFISHMGLRPSPRHSIERLDTNGNYEPGNCRWATPKEQSNNRRDTHYVVFKGERMPIALLADRHSIRQETLRGRLRRGWSLEDAVLEPVKTRPKVD